MGTTVREVIGVMGTIAPPWMRYDDDPIGLHAGHPNWKVNSILVALDATLAVVKEARRRRCQMVVTHHPRFYRPLMRLDESEPVGQLAAEIVRARLAVYAAHTNLDMTPGGINDILADLAGMCEERKPMVPVAEDRLLKLTTFVPEEGVEKVRKALCRAGAGVIGKYTDCSFRTTGIGTFRGGETAKPYLGNAGRFEEVKEFRLEVRFSESSKNAVVRALLDAHPYEEPAYDVYPLLDSETYGQGRMGLLNRRTTLRQLARKMKKAADSQGTLVLGDPEKPIRKVGVWSGGGFEAGAVARLKLDALVLGEIAYHDCEVLQQVDTGCIALGHGPCEEVALTWLAKRLHDALPGIAVRVTTKGTVRMWSL